MKDLAESVSKLILEKQEALESLGLYLVREKDVLTEVLGSLEQERESNQQVMLMWKPSKKKLKAK